MKLYRYEIKKDNIIEHINEIHGICKYRNYRVVYSHDFRQSMNIPNSFPSYYTENYDWFVSYKKISSEQIDKLKKCRALSKI